MAVKAAAAEIYTSRAHRQLFECVKEIVKTNVSLDSWDELTAQLVNESVLNKVNLDEKIDGEGTANDDEMQTMEEFINSREKRQKFENGYVTIGCCGFPNVGKSSLLNSLKGRKCVSVSKTPGHTKHLQTIFLTKNVRLCDCPGLVFPSLSKKPLQVNGFTDT
jgi:ribosome biogenesis GTPase A